MSSTSSIETPTTPTAELQQQQQHHHHHHQHTTTAIVASQQKQQPLFAKRSHSVSSSASSASSVSYGAAGAGSGSGIGAGTSLSANDRGGGKKVQTPPIPQSVSANGSATIAAVHHQQQQRQSYSALLQKQPPFSNRHQQQQQQGQQMQAQPISQLGNLSASTASSTGNTVVGGGSSLSEAPAAATTSSSSSSSASSSSSSSCCTDIKTNVTLTTQKTHRPIPSDKINLRLILVTGKTKEFLFNPSDSAGDIAQTVFDNWPEDWAREAVSKAEILRLIYQGRFLHCNVTLGALGLPLGKTTVMHLVPRDNLPEPNSQDQRQKSKGGSGRCCSTTCCIL